MSALRFCSAFTTSAPTLPVPPVTKIFILEISCRLLYELAKDGLRHADYVANLWPSAFDHASSLALLVGTFLYLWAHTRKKRLAKGSARAVYYPGFFGAFWIVFTTFAMRLADFEGPRGATRRAALIAFCSNGWSWSTTLSSDLFTRIRPLYSMKPSLRKRFIKRLTRERVVPIISARVSCVISGRSVCGSAGLSNSAISNRTRARRFSLELKSWSTRSACVRMLRARKKDRNRSEKACSSWITRIISFLFIFSAVQTVIAVAVASRLPGTAATASSPTNSPGDRSVIVASFPALDTTVSLARPS